MKRKRISGLKVFLICIVINFFIVALQDERKSAGFGGFVKVGGLKKDLSAVPPVMGVYMILRDSST